jgi:hypothetical protein
VITLFFTAKLPSREPRLYDPEVSYGAVLVGIEDPPHDLLRTIEQTLRTTGGRVKTDLLTT